MELTLAERKAVTKAISTRYARLDKAGQTRALDELCAIPGWHRDHARKALKQALRPRIVKAGRPRSPRYGTTIVASLIFCWAVLRMRRASSGYRFWASWWPACVGSASWISTKTPTLPLGTQAVLPHEGLHQRQRCRNWGRTRKVDAGWLDTVFAGHIASRAIVRHHTSHDVRLGFNVASLSD
jgi:hypothetical protein